MSLPPYVRGSATSKAAAVSQIHAVKADEARVLSYIQGCGYRGATDDEVEVALSMLHQTASARRRGLVLKDFVIDSGRTRPTRTGCHATVWVTPANAKLAPVPPPSAPASCPHGEQRPSCILCRTRR